MTTWRNILPTIAVSVALSALSGWLLAYGSYKAGYRDGWANRPPQSQAQIDAQCSAWWTDSDVASAKQRLCGKGK